MGKLQALVAKITGKPVMPKIDSGLRNKILKNNDAILDVLATHMKGAKACPFLGGQPCIGPFCEHFLEYRELDAEGKEKKKFYQCSHVAVSNLLIELNRNIRQLKSGDKPEG